jgi:host factor-I protein
VKLTGRIRSFDKYSVVLETSNQEQLIFKHAISTVVIARAAHTHGEGKPAPVTAIVEAAAAPGSGTQG